MHFALKCIKLVKELCTLVYQFSHLDKLINHCTEYNFYLI